MCDLRRELPSMYEIPPGVLTVSQEAGGQHPWESRYPLWPSCVWPAALCSSPGKCGAAPLSTYRLSYGLQLPPTHLRGGTWSAPGAVLPSSQLDPERPGQHLHSRAVTVLYITLYVGLTTVL